MKAAALIRAVMAWTGAFCVTGPAFVLAAEPDNDAQHAGQVKVGEKFSFSIEPLHDRDYFTLPSPGRGTLRVKLARPLQKHGNLYVWWGEDSKGNEQRGGVWDRWVDAGETCVLGIRSSGYSFNEVTHDEVVECVLEFIPEPAASERNDTAASAEPAEAGKKVSLRISPLFDRDYFTLPSPGDGTLRFILTQPLKQHRSLHPWWGEDKKGHEIRGGIWDRRVAAGETCVFALRSNQHSFNEVTHDEVIEGMFQFVMEHASSEPNDTVAQAQLTSVGEKVSLTISPLHDRDYFTLASPGNGTLRFKLTKPLQQHRSLHAWWGEDKRGAEVRGGIWDRRVAAGETCVFALRSNQHSFNEATHDEVIEGVFEFVAETASSEPNDTLGQAQPTSVGERLAFAISPLHDRDYFTLVAPGRGTLRFKLTRPLVKHKHLHLWWGEDAKGNEIRDGEWDRRVEAGERCILGVRSSRHSFNESTHDEVMEGMFEFVVDALPGEPNDTPPQAQAVTLEKPFEAIFLPLHDRDYFKIASPGAGVIRLARLDVDGPHRGLHPWWVRGADGTFVEGTWDHRVAKGETAVFGLRSSAYSFNESASEKAVSLHAAFVKEPLDTEKGDTPAEAMEVEIAKPFRFALMPSYDRDFIRVRSPQRGVLKVVFPRAPAERVDTWWQRAGSDEAIREPLLKVEADETVFLGLAPSGWSSDQVFEGEIRYADGAESPGEQTRRWTFKIDRRAGAQAPATPHPSPP
ncbi:MAG: hypothetical protein ACO1TE_02565 [Prosthecobacter sp.]